MRRQQLAIGSVLLHHILSINKTYGDHRLAISRQNGGAITGILFPIVARHILLLEDDASLQIIGLVHVHQHTLQRGNEGIVAQNDLGRTILIVRSDAHVVRAFRKVKAGEVNDVQIALLLTEAHDPNSGDATFASNHHGMAPKGSDVVEGTVRPAVEHDLVHVVAHRSPSTFRVGGGPAPHEAHVAGRRVRRPLPYHELTAPVGGDEPLPLPMLDVVQDPLPPLGDAFQSGVRLGQVEVVHLAGFAGARFDEQILFVGALADPHPEQIVGLLEEKFIGGITGRTSAGRQSPPIHLVGSVLVVHLEIKQSGIVGPPPDGAVNLQPLGMVHRLPADHVLDVQLVRFVAAEIDRIGHEVVGGTLGDGTGGAVVVSLREDILVEIYFLVGQDGRRGGIGRCGVPRRNGILPLLVVPLADIFDGRPHVNGVAFPLERSSIIVPLPIGRRSGVVCLLQPSHQFVVQLVPQPDVGIEEIPHDGGGVVILRLEMIQHFAGGPIVRSHPPVGIAQLLGWIEEGIGRILRLTGQGGVVLGDGTQTDEVVQLIAAEGLEGSGEEVRRLVSARLRWYSFCCSCR